MVGIIEYGAGNIRSVSNALNRLNVRYFISSDYHELDKADKLIFPGVGEARSAMEALIKSGLTDWLVQIRVPFLGICLGMQLLLNRTTERNTDCLGLLAGESKKFENEQSGLKVPHMGWNQVRHNSNMLLFKSIADGENFYFVHSYYVPLTSVTIGTTEYGVMFTSALKERNYYGVQFHPEKSGPTGLQLLRNFVELC